MKKITIKLSVLPFICFFLIQLTFSQQSEQILLTIKNSETYHISSDEFMRIYKKNNNKNNKTDIKEYLDLFINYKLKVIEAQEKGYDTTYSFIREFSNYKEQLAKPYLSSEEAKEALIRTFYEHMKYEIDVSHILLEVDFNKIAPDDTVKTYKKMLNIRKRIINGEPFEEVAKATSDDPQVKWDGGKKGYIKAFRFPFKFEMAAYNLSPGDISMPVRTKFGYHLIKVHDKRKSIGKIKVAHIYKACPNNTPKEIADSLKRLSFDIYKQLQEGEPFDKLARKYSDHKESARKGGEFRWFETGEMVPEFENACIALEKEGDISEPVKSPYGWHIIKLIGKKSLPPYEEIKDNIAKDIERTSAKDYLKDQFIKNRMKEYGIKTDTELFEQFYNIDEDAFKNGEWEIPAFLKTNKPLFTIGDAVYTQKDFAKFLYPKAGKKHSKNIPMARIINITYKEFINHCTMNYEHGQLEKKYPEYAHLLQEYKEGILLFNISDDNVWSKAVKDTVGLTSFYKNNKDNYMWGERVEASIYKCPDKKTAKKVGKLAGKRIRKGYSDEELIEKALKRADDEDTITIEKGVFSKGDYDIIDNLEWKEGISKHPADNDEVHVVHIINVLPPQPKTLDEARGNVTADYQNHLEKEWLKYLKDKYTVEINKDILNNLIEQQ